MKARAAALAGLVVLLSVAAGLQPVPQPPRGPKDLPKAAEKLPGPASADSPAPVGAAAFTIHLEPEFALENGPVVFRVTLTNRTGEQRECWRHTHDNPVWFTQMPAWVGKPTPELKTIAICGQYGPYRERVEGGKVATKVVAVQSDYLRIPPGRATVGFQWAVVGGADRSWKGAPRSTGIQVLREPGDGPREPVRGSQTFDVQPATPANVAAARETLERYLTEVVTGTRPIGEVIQCLTGSRHPEFVPLMIRAVQLRDCYQCWDLIDTIYDSYRDPATGFEHLIALVEAGDPACLRVLDYWHHQDYLFQQHCGELETLAKLRAGHREVFNGYDLTDYSWNWVGDALAVWNFARPHPNTRLTAAQHARIRAVKNVWARVAYWQTFPEQCSPFWVLRLLADLSGMTSPPNERVIEAACRGLTDNRFPVRERATADVLKMDGSVVPALRDYLKLHPSAELEQRITLIARNFEQQPLPPLAVHVIESAMNRGDFQGELIFDALSAPPGSCRLADYVREKRPEQQRRRQEQLARKQELERPPSK